MKKKELKELAKKIAKYETVIQESSDEDEKENAKNAILRLADSIESLEDMSVLDELIQNQMYKKNT